MSSITNELDMLIQKAKECFPNTATAIQNWDGWMDGWQCSYCKNAMIGNKPNYCPNCGRKFTAYQLKEEPKDEWEDTNEKDEDN